MTPRQCDELVASAVEKWIGPDKECPGSNLVESLERCVHYRMLLAFTMVLLPGRVRRVLDPAQLFAAPG